MDWKGFLASVIDSLAWPVAIAFIVVFLRKPLRRLLERRIRFKGLGVEAEFGDIVREAEETLAQTELPPPERTEGEIALSTELWPEISNAPRAAVIEAWLAVERELEALAERAGLDLAERGWAPAALAGHLWQRGVIEPSLAAVLSDLKNARDVAAHIRPYTVERDEVIDYVKLAGRVRSALRLARQSLEQAEQGRTAYDLLVYHDLSDPTETTGGAIPSVGDNAEEWFGEIGRDRHVVAVGPGIHDGRVTVVLAHGNRPMEEVQALLDRQQQP